MPDPAPTPAASVLLVRDGEDGLEVFMLERHLESDFVGGAFVFPGGKVDDADHEVEATLAGPPTDDLPYRIAAVRETFEEAGHLLAHPPLPDKSELAAARRRLNDRRQRWDWRPWLGQHTLQLATEQLAWWSWWVTPPGLHRRFDTRFYIVEVGQDAYASHDAVETTASRWVRPAVALRAAEAGQISIILPTRKNLEALAEFEKAADAVAHTAARVAPPPRIEPSIRTRPEGLSIDHPSFPGPEAL